MLESFLYEIRDTTILCKCCFYSGGSLRVLDHFNKTIKKLVKTFEMTLKITVLFEICKRLDYELRKLIAGCESFDVVFGLGILRDPSGDGFCSLFDTRIGKNFTDVIRYEFCNFLPQSAFIFAFFFTILPGDEFIDIEPIRPTFCS